jgi:hypothetical protein
MVPPVAKILTLGNAGDANATCMPKTQTNRLTMVKIPKSRLIIINALLFAEFLRLGCRNDLVTEETG